jgi:hypothetical protein
MGNAARRRGDHLYAMPAAAVSQETSQFALIGGIATTEAGELFLFLHS